MPETTFTTIIEIHEHPGGGTVVINGREPAPTGWWQIAEQADRLAAIAQNYRLKQEANRG